MPSHQHYVVIFNYLRPSSHIMTRYVVGMTIDHPHPCPGHIGGSVRVAPDEG
jgi:hypothetical protein